MQTIIKHLLLTRYIKSHLSFGCFHHTLLERAVLHADTFQCQNSFNLIVGNRQPESSDPNTAWV